jgi:hypothetical protein
MALPGEVICISPEGCENPRNLPGTAETVSDGVVPRYQDVEMKPIGTMSFSLFTRWKAPST